MIKASLIIAFYNRVDYLKLVFAGLKRQTFNDYEIIIADDGSKKEVVDELKNLIASFHVPVIYLWHEDKGFRKNKIMNSAIKASKSNYLIFIDGDCVPHKEFIKEHYNNRTTKTCLTGRRVNLSEKLTDSLTEKKIEDGFLENSFNLLSDGIFGNSNYVEKGIYFRNNFMRRIFNKKRRGLLGCNFSIHKDDFLSINGFDERYIYPSIGEDSDVQYRLELNGINIKSLNHIAVQYHLFHTLQQRKQVNLDLFEQVKKEKKFFTGSGIEKE